MPKRKKHERLPNAYGSIRYLGKNRKNPYAVHPPCKEISEEGDYVRPKAICYVDDWYVGFAVLNAWHAGTYKPGDEMLFKSYRAASATDLDAFCRRILTDFSAHAHVEEVKKENELTFAQVYEMYYEWKYGEHAARKLSKQSRDSTNAAYKNCARLHDQVFRDLKLDDLQSCLDECSLKKSSLELISTLLKQMYKFAMPRKLCDENFAQYLTMPDVEDDEHGVPFTDDELKKLWENKEDPTVEMILIMCYSGFRILAYTTMKADLEEMYFQGGVKTAAGKNRIVPIHSAIQPLVVKRLKRDGKLLDEWTDGFRRRMYRKLKKLGIEKHTPHDCRHTFSRLCEKYSVRETDRKRMLGHSFGADITNGIYGHRTLEELRAEIEKIKLPDL